LQARQNLNVPSDFSYGGVANELTTTNFAAILQVTLEMLQMFQVRLLS
jgi:hypothetical protein